MVRGRWPASLAAMVLTLVAGVALAALVGCRTGSVETGKVGVAVTILPQAEFVERVGGDKVSVTVMVPPGADPHTYEPRTSQMVGVARAKMYAKVGSGIEFELAFMNQLAAINRNMLVVDCSKGVELMAMTGEAGEGGEHGALDPHIWMSPRNAMIMVQNICEGLAQVDPDNRGYYEANRDAYLQELAQLDQDISNGLAGVTNMRFMVYHPALGYFARDHGLIMMAVEEEGKTPTSAALAQLIAQAREYNIKVVFASPQFDPRTAEVIAREIGGQVMQVDDLARDYVGNMRIFLAELIQAMEQA